MSRILKWRHLVWSGFGEGVDLIDQEKGKRLDILWGYFQLDQLDCY